MAAAPQTPTISSRGVNRTYLRTYSAPIPLTSQPVESFSKAPWGLPPFFFLSSWDFWWEVKNSLRVFTRYWSWFRWLWPGAKESRWQESHLDGIGFFAKIYERPWSFGTRRSCDEFGTKHNEPGKTPQMALTSQLRESFTQALQDFFLFCGIFLGGYPSLIPIWTAVAWSEGWETGRWRGPGKESGGNGFFARIFGAMAEAPQTSRGVMSVE